MTISEWIGIPVLLFAWLVLYRYMLRAQRKRNPQVQAEWRRQRAAELIEKQEKL